MLCACCDAPAGDNAEIGKINKLVSQVEQVKTNLLIQMEILGRWLAIIVVLIAVGAFLLALLHAHEPFAEAFKSAVAIAVAMIPEGLPALVTIVLALGTTKMAEHQAIIRQLPCVEVSKAVAGSSRRIVMTCCAKSACSMSRLVQAVLAEPCTLHTRQGRACACVCEFVLVADPLIFHLSCAVHVTDPGQPDCHLLRQDWHAHQE